MFKTVYKNKKKKTVVKTITIQLPGLTVYAPETEKVYLSKKALQKMNLLIKAARIGGGKLGCMPMDFIFRILHSLRYQQLVCSLEHS